VRNAYHHHQITWVCLLTITTCHKPPTKPRPQYHCHLKHCQPAPADRLKLTRTSGGRRVEAARGSKRWMAIRTCVCAICASVSHSLSPFFRHLDTPISLLLFYTLSCHPNKHQNILIGCSPTSPTTFSASRPPLRPTPRPRQRLALQPVTPASQRKVSRPHSHAADSRTRYHRDRDAGSSEPPSATVMSPVRAPVRVRSRHTPSLRRAPPAF
jgi:hypothetical protein